MKKLLCLNNHMMHVCLASGLGLSGCQATARSRARRPSDSKQTPLVPPPPHTLTHTQLATPFDLSTACLLCCSFARLFMHKTHIILLFLNYSILLIHRRRLFLSVVSVLIATDFEKLNFNNLKRNLLKILYFKLVNSICN